MIPHIETGTAEFVRLSRLYAARREAHPALAGHPTLDALLSALSGRGQVDAGIRRRVICAAIAEHQTAPGPLGAAIVLHAFRGMLVRLSRSLQGVDDRDEADALVTAGLLEALRRVRPGRDPERIGMYVRQETRRAVFKALRRDARGREHEPVDEDEPCEDESPPDEDGDDAWSEDAPRDPLAVQRALRRRVPDEIEDPESLEPLEHRMLFIRPTVDAIPDETVLRAGAVRGGLRRLASLLFEHASPLERRRVYRQLVARAEPLLAARQESRVEKST